MGNRAYYPNRYIGDLVDYVEGRGYEWTEDIYFSFPTWKEIYCPETGVGFFWDIPLWRLCQPEWQGYYAGLGEVARRFKRVFTASEYFREVASQLWGVRCEVLRGWFPEKQWGDGWRGVTVDRIPMWKPYFVVVGRNDAHKGFDFAERVWRDGGFDLSHGLVFVHPHGAKKDCYKPGPGVTVLREEIGYAGVLTALQHARAVLCPSRLEGMGLVPMEAASVGAKRVLMTDLSVSREYYGDCWPMKLLPLDESRWIEELRKELEGRFGYVSGQIKLKYGYSAALARLESLGLVKRGE